MNHRNEDKYLDLAREYESCEDDIAYLLRAFTDEDEAIRRHCDRMEKITEDLAELGSMPGFDLAYVAECEGLGV
jgi:hypothetical protein